MHRFILVLRRSQTRFQTRLLYFGRIFHIFYLLIFNYFNILVVFYIKKIFMWKIDLGCVWEGLQPRNKISVITDISVLEFYRYIENIGKYR